MLAKLSVPATAIADLSISGYVPVPWLGEGGGNTMRRSALALAFVISLSSIAKADVVYLACTEITANEAPRPNETPRTLSITIDMAQHTATVDNSPPARFIDQQNAVISFYVIGRTATLNRVTGHVQIDTGPSGFEGTCMPAQRLF
jgi:hypothetical protein